VIQRGILLGVKGDEALVRLATPDEAARLSVGAPSLVLQPGGLGALLDAGGGAYLLCDELGRIALRGRLVDFSLESRAEPIDVSDVGDSFSRYISEPGPRRARFTMLIEGPLS
jgi:hypothetical protein